MMFECTSILHSSLWVKESLAGSGNIKSIIAHKIVFLFSFQVFGSLCSEHKTFPPFKHFFSLLDVLCVVIVLSLSTGETMLWKARNFADRELFQKAQNIRMPSCDTLHELQAQAG